MKIEPGDTIELFSDQVRGFYLHGGEWFAHTARPGRYEVLQVEGEGVLLGICCKLGGMDLFRCSMDGLRAVVLPPSLTKFGSQYRRLEKGEIIQEGDEIDRCADAWRDDPVWEPAGNIGEPAPDPQYPSHRQYRRKIAS